MWCNAVSLFVPSRLSHPWLHLHTPPSLAVSLWWLLDLLLLPRPIALAGLATKVRRGSFAVPAAAAGCDDCAAGTCGSRQGLLS